MAQNNPRHAVKTTPSKDIIKPEYSEICWIGLVD